jgi:hypothetical protein
MQPEKENVMKSIAVLSLGLLVLSISRPAAGGKDSGLYVGGAVGTAKINITEGIADFDDNDLGYKIFAGYNFGVIPLIDVAVEGSYVDFGSASDAQILNQDVGFSAWDVFGVGTVNLGPVGVFGKLGAAWWRSDSDILQGILDDSGYDIVYGIGARVQLGSFAIRAEYERFDIEIANIDYVSVGGSYTF